MRRAWIAAAACAVFVCLVLLGFAASWSGAAVERASAESIRPITHEARISDAGDAGWHPLFALVGETYSVTLQRITLASADLSIWKPALDGSPARMVARAPHAGVPLIWTAPESGAWQVRVVGRNLAVGTYRLSVQVHTDAIGADLATAKLSAFADDGTLIERSSIDNGGDVDWFAIPVAPDNRYQFWSVTGSLGSLAAEVRAPSGDEFRELGRHGNAFSDIIEVDEHGLAVIAVRGGEAWMQGSYAFGVTRWGTTPEPDASLPPRPTSTLQIASIEASASEGEASFRFSGDWGPIRTNSGLRVWIDVDPGVDAEDEWEYLLRSDDGRSARLWSFEREAWVGSSAVGASGFDTLVMRWSGRTADRQIRWQASVKNWNDTWTVSQPSLLEVPDPQPPLPDLWHARQRTGSEDPRWQAELEAAGIVPGLDDDARVVVIDAGHGVDTGAWDNGVKEEDSNLAFALRVEELLEAAGVKVIQTRRSTDRPFLNLDEALWRPDFQVRAELAHLAQADAFVSLHSNANFDLPLNGLEAWYWPRWNGDGLNLRLSETLLAHIQEALTSYGYHTSSLTYDATCWELVNGVCDPIYVLAPFLLLDADAARRWGLDPAELGLSEDPWGAAINDWLWRNDVTVGEPPIDLINPETQTGPGRIVRGNLMPTTLLELLYVTHAGDARILRDPSAREVIAQAIADGILEFLDIE